MRDYQKIETWKIADDLTVAIYKHTRSFPQEEVYGLTTQLRRASYAVPANIVEGSSHENKKDYLHFLYTARASLSETHYFIHLAHRLNYLTDDEAEKLFGQTKKVFAGLHGLIQTMEKESGKLARMVGAVTGVITLGLWS